MWKSPRDLDAGDLFMHDGSPVKVQKDALTNGRQRRTSIQARLGILCACFMSLSMCL